MKKLTAAIAALALYCSASAFGPTPENANEAIFNPINSKSVNVAKVSKTITSAFQEKFANATEISWRENQGIYFGYFNQGDKAQVAAYTMEGELFAMSEQVKFNDLPAAVKESLKTRFDDCTFSDVTTMIVMQGEQAYYLNAENKSSVRLLKVSPEGNIQVISKTKKKVLVGTVR